MRLVACLLGNMNSLVADYVTRQKIPGTHLKYNIFKQITLLPPEAYTEAEIPWVTSRVVRLCHSSEAMNAFARDMGSDASPEPLSDSERRLLRADLDAFFAWKYGLSRNDLRYVLDPASVKGDDYPSETFRSLRDKEKLAFGNEYRTQTLVLEAWDRLSAQGFKVDTDAPAVTTSVLTSPAEPPRAALRDGAWARANPNDGDVAAALAAILKRLDGPMAIARVKMAAAFVVEAHFLTTFLPDDQKAEWMRLVGQEATPRTGNVTAFARRVIDPWGATLSTFRGNGLLVENLTEDTWAPGRDLERRDTAGWPDGRTDFVLDAMQRLDPMSLASRLPDEIRAFVFDAAAA